MKPRTNVKIFSAVDGRNGRPIFTVVRDTPPLTRTVAAEPGAVCRECQHATRDRDTAGCCRHVDYVDVICCPNCETIRTAAEAVDHLLMCYGGAT